MKFDNPQVNHDVNVSAEHPLKEFVQLLAGLLVVGIVMLAVIHFAAGYFASKIPFRYEIAMVSHIDALRPTPSAQRETLQALADRISARMDLPPEMTITVHYSDEEIVNAFATLGGHVFFYKGLISKLESEDALAMVMAHEIAHVKHRHPIVSMGKGLTILALMGSIVGSSGSAAGETLLGTTIQVGLLKFSRDQERESDLTASAAINASYGHILGAKALFDLFDKVSAGQRPPELLSSHPHSTDRWESLRAIAPDFGWQTNGDLTPLVFAF
ncbi:MAG: M48 family metallopeptidase [Burkholderiaceae bacterium]